MKAKVNIITDLLSAKRDALGAMNLIQEITPCCRSKKVNNMIKSVYDEINLRIHKRTFNLIKFLSSNPIVEIDENGVVKSVA